MSDETLSSPTPSEWTPEQGPSVEVLDRNLGFLRGAAPDSEQLLTLQAARAAHTLYAENRSFQQEVKRLNGELLGIEELHYTRREITAAMSGEATKAVAILFAEALRGADAPNYIEMQLADPETHERFTVTVQRATGKTPHDCRKEAEAEVARLTGELAALRHSCGGTAQ
jgi:hypothetical protein